MSEKKITRQLNRIVNMLLQQTLLHKEVFNSKEAAIDGGQMPFCICILASRNLFTSPRHKDGKRFFKRKDLRNWLLSFSRKNNSPISEAEKMAILNPERE